MALTPISLDMVRGDTATFIVTVVRSSSPVNLVGASVWFTAKRSYGDADAYAVFQKSSNPVNGVTTPDATGIVTVTVDPGDTLSLSGHETTNLVWDAQIREASGNVTTVARGTLTVYADATQAIV